LDWRDGLFVCRNRTYKRGHRACAKTPIFEKSWKWENFKNFQHEQIDSKRINYAGNWFRKEEENRGEFL